MSRRYDAIVVGAQCAGAATAMLLARRGFDVLLVDRARFPSEVPRGHYVRMHGPPRLAAWRLLDQVLVDAAIEAGAEFRDGFGVYDFTFDHDRVTGVQGPGGLTERARFVIGADGRNSRVAKRVSAPAYAEHRTLACWYFAYWSGVASEGLEMYRRDHRMIFAHPTNDELFAVFVGWPIAELPVVRSDIDLATHVSGRAVRTTARVSARRFPAGPSVTARWGAAG